MLESGLDTRPQPPHNSNVNAVNQSQRGRRPPLARVPILGATLGVVAMDLFWARPVVDAMGCNGLDALSKGRWCKRALDRPDPALARGLLSLNHHLQHMQGVLGCHLRLGLAPDAFDQVPQAVGPRP